MTSRVVLAVVFLEWNDDSFFKRFAK